MIIYMLATAMTLVMLIGTALGLREEAERIKLAQRSDQERGFGIRRRQSF